MSAPVTPPVRLFRQFSARENGWSDHYGAFHVAADYAGCALPERYAIHGIWQHGSFRPSDCGKPSLLVCGAPDAEKRVVWVARRDEEACLLAAGYSKARAIGLPMLYTRPTGLARIPRSLLVMPGHSLVGWKVGDRSAYRRYAGEIAAQAGDFDRVVVCISPSCRKNGLWVDEFTARGFEIVYGAQTDDLNALMRIRALCEQFETVTTNSWGSHVAYALAFGARVSIGGTFPSIDAANLMVDMTWRTNPALLAQATSDEAMRQERELLRSFYVPPREAVADRKLGEWLLGTEQKISPAEMRELLVGMVDPVLPEPVSAARTSENAEGSRLLFVISDTQRSNGNLDLLNLLRWLRRERAVAFDVLIGTPGGALQEEFAKIATLFLPGNLIPSPEWSSVYRLACVVPSAASTLAAAGFVELPPLWLLATEGVASLEQVAARDLAWLQRHTVRYYCCNEEVAEALGKRYGVPKERIATLPMGVDRRRIALCATQSDVAQLRASFEIPDTSFVVVATGLLDYRHGADLLPLILRSLRAKLGAERDVVFFWSGAVGSAEFDQVLAQDVRILGLGQHCRFLGEFAQESILLALADLICVPGRDVAITPTLREAQALGKPLVAFAQSGPVADLCAVGAGDLAPYLDIEAMACCMAERLLRGERVVTKGPAVLELQAGAEAMVQDFKQMPPLAYDRKERRALREVYESWRLADKAPQGGYVRAYLQRQKERVRASQLAVAGRKPEAMKLLIVAAQGALALKDPYAITEALLEIAHDLGRLDGRQGEAVLAEAQKFCRARGLNLEHIRKTLDL